MNHDTGLRHGTSELARITNGTPARAKWESHAGAPATILPPPIRDVVAAETRRPGQQDQTMPLGYNEPITFGNRGSATTLNCSGIDFTEDRGESWTMAPVAEIDIQLPFARQDVILQIEASPFIVPDLLPSQKVFIFLGGLFVGYATLIGHAVRSFPVNRGAVSGRAARLTLVLPSATSPESLNLSEDQRELGILLSSIGFRTVP